MYGIERGKLDQLRPYVWQTDTSIGLKSWSYVEGETFRSANSLVDDLIDITSKNGLLLLNIGPRADGTIPDEVRATLLNIGKWLNVNGEAIYGTRPYQVFGEGPTKASALARNDPPLLAKTDPLRPLPHRTFRLAAPRGIRRG